MVKCQADIERFSNLRDTVIHNGHTEGELTHIIIEWAQMEVGKVTIVTRSYRWTKFELVFVCVCMLCNFTGAKLYDL